MTPKLKLYSSLWIVYFLLAFPLFYFAYKFGNPLFGANDFESYHKLYRNWDIANVDAPFNMRLFSSYLVFLLNKTGLHYNTEIALDKLPDMDKQVFFNAMLFNFMCIVTTCVLLFRISQKYFGNYLLSFVSGLVYLLGFGTLFYEFMPLTDACSVLLLTITFSCYLSRSYLIAIPFLLLILQREYIFLAFGLITVMDYWKYREKFYLHTLAMCILCFAIYYLLRKTVFYTPLYDHQSSPAYFFQSLLEIKFPLIPYLKQTLMTLNIFIIYVMILLYKKINKLEIDGYNFLKTVFLFLQINIISFAAVFGNNTGRYFYILVPIIIFYLTKEALPLLEKANDTNSRIKG